MKLSHILLTVLPLSQPASSLTTRQDTNSSLNLNYTLLSHRALDGLNTAFFNTTAQRWSPDDAWWLSAIALTNLLSYSISTNTTSYLPQITSVLEAQSKPLPWWPQGNGSFRADSTDDTGWYALALLSTYDLTHNSTYLSLTTTDEAYMSQYWLNTSCSGGLIQQIPSQSYKNAISNELYISLAAGLYLRTDDKNYLDKAVMAWDWFRESGMINQQDLVNDGLTSDCRNNNQTEWSYNQGVILGALVDLYHATGNSSYLSQAKTIADAAIAVSTSPLITTTDNSPSGTILTESCEHDGRCNNDQQAFKGIFAYNLGKLDREFDERPYRGVLTAWAETMWRYDKAVVQSDGVEGDLYDVSWAGPYGEASLGRQVSAGGLLVGLID
ncbi:glycoside hydrolase family 76 protein [Triangularia verruculosa]|uniref:Glycoside hydrolase family 76 protein n=1 Tax=Triangularia verruculosa TaxID=2587418 RepID=A0AAN6X9Q2_9PEZI|nr:glycoside hydrolase family 76 protein [Triangularia verruculosa]